MRHAGGASPHILTQWHSVSLALRISSRERGPPYIRRALRLVQLQTHCRGTYIEALIEASDHNHPRITPATPSRNDVVDRDPHSTLACGSRCQPPAYSAIHTSVLMSLPRKSKLPQSNTLYHPPSAPPPCNAHRLFAPERICF